MEERTRRNKMPIWISIAVSQIFIIHKTSIKSPIFDEVTRLIVAQKPQTALIYLKDGGKKRKSGLINKSAG